MKLSYRSILFILIVLLPFGLFSFYELDIATDRFHSGSSVTVSEDKKFVPSIDLSAIGLSSPGGSSDALTLIAFMNSTDMIDYLDQKLGLRQHYGNKDVDWWSRLPETASKEDFYDYFSGMMSVELDPVSHLVQIHVQAFDREYARKIVNALLERGQDLVDRLNAKMIQEKIEFFEKQLTAADLRMRKAKEELLRFQHDNQLLTADAEAGLLNRSISEINSKLIAKQGQLAVSLGDLNETSPAVKRIKAEIETLKQQLATEKDRLSVGSDGSPVSAIAAHFAEIQANVNFLEGMYKSNLVQLEAARVEAVQRLKYLIVVTQPTIADSSLYPNRKYNVATAAILLLMVFFVVSLMIAVVREHA